MFYTPCLVSKKVFYTLHLRSPAFKLASSIGLRKTKAARCKPSYATTGAENQNARMNPEDKKT